MKSSHREEESVYISAQETDILHVTIEYLLSHSAYVAQSLHVASWYPRGWILIVPDDLKQLNRRGDIRDSRR